MKIKSYWLLIWPNECCFKKITSCAEYSLIFLGLFLLAFTINPQISSDGEYRYNAMIALVEGGQDFIVKYSLVQPILSIPLYFVAKFMGLEVKDTVAYFNFCIFTIGCLFIYKSVSAVYCKQVARMTILILTSASMVPHHLQSYFVEVSTSILLVIAVIIGKSRPLLSVLMAGLALANSPALILPMAIVGLVAVFRKISWWPLLAMLVALLIMFGENYLKYGSAFTSPYFSVYEKGEKTIMPYSGIPGFSYPLFLGLLSIILSFGKGLIFYIPSLSLFFLRAARQQLSKLGNVTFLCAVFSISTIVVYSKWWAWYGGGYWGPRFFLFLCFPAALIMAIMLTTNTESLTEFLTIIGVTMLSVWVGIDGYLFGQTNLDICWQNKFALEFLCWYTPEFSALWRPFVSGDIATAYKNPRAAFAMWQVTCGIYFIFSYVNRNLNFCRVLVSNYRHAWKKLGNKAL